MLTKEQIELVKTTVPVLREHGVALISHFYKRMLSHNPELRSSIWVISAPVSSNRLWPALFWLMQKTSKILSRF